MAADSRTSAPWGLALVVQVAFIVVAAMFVFGFIAMGKEGERRRVCSAPCLLHPDYLGANRLAPNFAVADMRGRRVELAQFRGKVVVLNFWSKTCAPCLEEMPDLAELTRALQSRPDVVVLAMSSDEGSSDVIDTLRTALKDDPPFDVLFDPDSSVIGEKYGTHLFPETWFIDKNGIIRARFDRVREWSGGLVVEYIDDLRRGDTCPATIEGNTLQGSAAAECEDLAGG